MSKTSITVTVAELTASIKNQLESQFSLVKVRGEISNFKPHSGGHLYFDLKDAEAKIPAVMFRGSAATLARMPKEGDHVEVQGSLTVYAPHGRYQLIVKTVEFSGLGALLLELEERKKKLASLGWFDQSRKKALPKFPKRIGIVTSPTGSVIRDIIHVLSRRSGGVHVILNPVRVQGTGSAKEIAEAIEQFNRYQLVDVMIVGRGGGSLEDLWAFNEEVVAQAIFASAIPIISAVGHETDTTIADFVADVRAPTPSAAAEIVASERIHHLQFLKKMQESLSHALLHQLKYFKERLERWKAHPLFASPYALLGLPLQRLDDLRDKLDDKMKELVHHRRLLVHSKQRETDALKPTAQLRHIRQKMHLFLKRLDESKSRVLVRHKEQLFTIVSHLHSLDPKNVLKRGYSILFAQNKRSVIVSARELTPGLEVEALLSDGEIPLTVKNYE